LALLVDNGYSINSNIWTGVTNTIMSVNNNGITANRPSTSTYLRAPRILHTPITASFSGSIFGSGLSGWGII
jgi:hypothetical protein